MSGGEIALLNLIRHIDRTRFEPVVLLFSDGPLKDRLREIDVETHVMNLDGKVLNARKDALGIRSLFLINEIFASLSFVFSLRREIRKLKPHVLHTNSLKSDVLGGIAGRLSGVPVVWHVRDRITTKYLPPVVVSAFRTLARTLPDFVIANSRSTLESLDLHEKPDEAIYSRAKTQRAFAIHDGIEPRGFRPDFKSISTLSGNRQKRIGLIGRISPWKGQGIFIQAAARVLKKFPDARFVIAGSAMFGEHDFERQVKELAGELGVTDCVDFLGFVENVPDLLSSLDMVVHASTIGEPFGQVVIEGMASGKAVIATDGGGVPELIEHGKSGLLIPMSDPDAMADAIVRLLSDEEYMRQIARAGYERAVREFSIERTSELVQHVYNQLESCR